MDCLVLALTLSIAGSWTSRYKARSYVGGRASGGPGWTSSPDCARGVHPQHKRAIFLKFLIAEVHAFTDGNRRVARVFMNAELD
jgi:hypothetical protein